MNLNTSIAGRKKTVVAALAGVVDNIQQTGDTWLVRVLSRDGSHAVYTDLDIVMVMHCDSVLQGDVIGYQLLDFAASAGGWSAPVVYMGDDTKIYQDDRLKNATAVIWFRAGIYKAPGGANDSYSFNPASGTITSTEVQTSEEQFMFIYKQ